MFTHTINVQANYVNCWEKLKIKLIRGCTWFMKFVHLFKHSVRHCIFPATHIFTTQGPPGITHNEVTFRQPIFQHFNSPQDKVKGSNVGRPGLWLQETSLSTWHFVNILQISLTGLPLRAASALVLRVVISLSYWFEGRLPFNTRRLGCIIQKVNDKDKGIHSYDLEKGPRDSFSFSFKQRLASIDFYIELKINQHTHETAVMKSIKVKSALFCSVLSLQANALYYLSMTMSLWQKIIRAGCRAGTPWFESRFVASHSPSLSLFLHFLSSPHL